MSNTISPLISVVMPVYNSEKFLIVAIESILDQTYEDFEFIIIDDGSNDRSLQIIQSYASKDGRIKVLKNQTNKGISFSRNLGLDVVQGKYIAVMDADDISLRDRFEKQISYMETHPEIDVLGSQIIAFDGDFNFNWKSQYPLSPGLVSWKLLFGCPLAHPSVMMKRNLFDDGDIRYGTAKAAQDYALWVNLCKSYKLANLSDVLLLYRIHENNMSRRGKQDQQQETFEIIRSEIQDITGIPISDEIIKGLMVSKFVKDDQDSIFLSKIIIQLNKTVRYWKITTKERNIIRRMVAHKLRSIWVERSHTINLLPYVFYSILLNLRAMIPG